MSNFFVEYVEENVQNKAKFCEWIMRAWFNPKKYSKSSWYNVNVDSSTVIEHIANLVSFPYSAQQLVEIWNIIPGLQFGLGAPETTVDDENVTETAVYKKGEQTLSAIGAELGDISATMIKKIGDGAEEKLKKLYQNKSPVNDFSVDDEKSLNDLIENARFEASEEYASMLKNSNGDVNLFLVGLVKNQILSNNESSLISENEISNLKKLSMMDVDLIEEILLEDIDCDSNTFKTFQNAVSKKIYPNRKRGRPRKELSLATIVNLPTKEELDFQEMEEQENTIAI